jgi:hypothetical protein
MAAGLAFARAGVEKAEPTRQEVVTDPLRVVVSQLGNEYMLYVDAKRPVRTVAVALGERSPETRFIEIDLDELDLKTTEYRWHGERSLGFLEDVPEREGVKIITAFVLHE